MNILVRDVVVIGAGASGLLAAVECAQRGLSVSMLDKGIIGNDCATVSAKGLAAVGSWSPSGDGPEAHIRDTIRSGCHLNDPALVETMVRGAESVLLDLEQRGMPFDKTADGRWMLKGTPPGHSGPRNLGFSDITGKMLIDTLVAQCRKLRVDTKSDWIACGLVGDHHGVAGVVALDLAQGEFCFVRSRSVVVATGGIGQIYPLSSNCVQNTGDGIAMAFEAGLDCSDMEFVQFYPVTVIYPLTLRGMNTNSTHLGAHLKNGAGERFMLRYEPEDKEEVTRDRLSQCIFREISEGRATPHGGVYLDATMIPGDVYAKRIPSEWNLCVAAGFDLTKDSLEVAPSAHYYMGGIRIGVDAGTAMPGLFAAGECTAGVNGANRLANNSLTEVLSIGKVAGESAAAYALKNQVVGYDPGQLDLLRTRASRHLTAPSDAPSPLEVRTVLQQTMGTSVGITRNEKGLLAASAKLADLQQSVAQGMRASPKGTVAGLRMNRQLWLAIETDLMLVVARAITEAALMRTESRGAHYRDDHPQQSQEWTKNIDLGYDRGTREFTAKIRTPQGAVEGVQR